MTIEINAGKFNDIDEGAIRNTIQQTLEHLREFAIMEEKVKVILSVALVSENEIARLNKQYRQNDKSTDVLSFCYRNGDVLEGEIILAPEVIEKNSQEDKIEFQEELKKNIIHSILHIIGYEHSDEMFGLQKKILDKVKNLKNRELK